MSWFVFDPSPMPEDGPNPRLYGPFKRKDEAEEYANLLHPDDESGNTVVLRAETVET